jgi:hypothetical protein
MSTFYFLRGDINSFLIESYSLRGDGYSFDDFERNYLTLVMATCGGKEENTHYTLHITHYTLHRFFFAAGVYWPEGRLHL